MNDMFKNYPQPEDYIPTNRQKHHRCRKIDIMVGETSVHSFDIPFNVEEQCLDYKIIYALGVNDILIISKEDIDVVLEDDGTSILSCVISPEQTRFFNSTLLDTRVQIKFIMNDGSTVFSEIYKVIVRESLDKELEN